MQDLQLGRPTDQTIHLTSEGQFLKHRSSGLCYLLPEDVDFHNCSCHLYIDNYLRLQVSIVRFLVNRI